MISIIYILKCLIKTLLKLFKIIKIIIFFFSIEIYPN